MRSSTRTARTSSPTPTAPPPSWLVALKPLHDAATIKRVVVATYQAVSGNGQGGDGRAVGADQAGVRARSLAAAVLPQADRLQRHPFRQQLGWTTATPTKSTRCGTRPTRSLDPEIKLPSPACGCRCSSAIRAVHLEFEHALDEARRGDPEEAPGVMVIDKRERTGYHHAQGSAGRVRGVRQPHPQRPDRRARHRALGGVGQSAQRRRPQRGADRRARPERGLIGHKLLA